MSDTTDDLDAAGRRLLDEARTGSLRDHLAVNGPPEDVETFREKVTSETCLSEVADEERDGRV